jgi:hypothetical protein
LDIPRDLDLWFVILCMPSCQKGWDHYTCDHVVTMTWNTSTLATIDDDSYLYDNNMYIGINTRKDQQPTHTSNASVCATLLDLVP